MDQSLAGHTAEAIEGSSRAVQQWGRRLRGRTVVGAESRGKHLLVHFDGGFSLKTHLGMTGVWHVYGRDEPWRHNPGAARVVIRTATAEAVCFAAPTVDAGPTAQVLATIAHLGPDLLGEEFDFEACLERAHRSDAATLVDLLLDQRVMAGVGNVYKSEILFQERWHPLTPPAALDDDEVLALARRARRLLRANREDPRRATTGSRRRGGELWVYGRRRRPCRRCGTNIEAAQMGDPARITYWCPRCQPAPD